ncbi:hypothetical protein Aab01nite_64800 [Paractinoplanes abujensis]|nr:hypothetical protein Aab01nite_64800 [Actinoplanes abujensis]
MAWRTGVEPSEKQQLVEPYGLRGALEHPRVSEPGDRDGLRVAAQNRGGIDVSADRSWNSENSP